MGRKEERKKGITLKIADWMVYAITVAALVGLVIAYYAPYVDPNRTAWVAFFGLAAPAFYLACLVLMLYWALRWRRIALVLLVTLLIGTGNLFRFWRPVPGRQYHEFVPTSTTLRVMTYNVDGFRGEFKGQTANRMREITAYIRESDPDIICLQEYEVNYRVTAEDVDQQLEAWPYKAVHFTLEGNDTHSYGWGIVIYSKFPIVRRHTVSFPGSNNSALWADVVVRRDTIRVFNNHLQTTQVDEQDREFIGYEALTDSLRNDKAMSIARKLKRNFQIRATQVDTLARIIHENTRRVIVCGDFNDTPMSYTYRVMRGDLVDAFVRKGDGVVSTYKRLYGLFRIDYIFHSRDFETLAYRVDHLPWSDHNPVVVDIKPKNK